MAEDDKPETEKDEAGASPAGPPEPEDLPLEVPVEWSEEERELLAQLEGGREADTTEAMRRLVLGILRQARSGGER